MDLGALWLTIRVETGQQQGLNGLPVLLEASDGIHVALMNSQRIN